MNTESLAEKIKKIRIEQELTQQHVANALAIDRSTYSYYESGKIIPSIDMILKISRVLNVHYTRLLEDNENASSVNFSDCIDDNRSLNMQICDLTKNEKQMILYFRTLDDESKLCSLKKMKKYLELNKKD